MFTKIEAHGYRCLREVSQELGPYQVLVGPNASGKSTFLDVIGFLGDVITLGLQSAVAERSENFDDLVWGRNANCFTIAVEATRPAADLMADFGIVRYEVGVKIDPQTDQVVLCDELLSLKQNGGSVRPVISRNKQRVAYKAESEDFVTEFTLGPTQTGLGNLPMDRTKFPGATWLKETLVNGIQLVELDNDLLSGSSPPGQGKPRLFDGLSLPRRVYGLADSSPERFDAWIKHLQTALPDIDTVKTVARPEDRHRYLVVKYRNGIEVPGWMVSDGTLRLLALTLLAYTPESNAVYLIEEPEVGVHPSALETIMQSLSSIYHGQAIITTHSPLIVGWSSPEKLLCFQKTDRGTKIVSGNEHPRLKDWQSSIEVSDLFAAGVLG